MSANIDIICGRVRQLPKDITDRIFIYLIDSVGINKILSEDIKHLVRCKCTLQTTPVVYYSEEILLHANSYMRERNLFEKYKRKMVLIRYKRNYELSSYEYDENDYEKIELPEKIYQLSQYVRNSIPGMYDIDSRSNQYSKVAKLFNTDIFYDEYLEAMSCYRAIHNIVSIMEPVDRSNFMQYIEHYCTKILPFVDEDFAQDYYQEEYGYNGYDEYYEDDSDED